MNGRFGEFTGHLDRDPRVHFVNDEARSFLARQTDRYDVLQISLIDTWAATAAGAFVMSENSLYTTEAWRVFLSRLTDTGVLSVSRWYSTERPGEIYRLVGLASAALAEAGIAEPQAHMLLVRNIRAEREEGQPEGVGTLLVSRTPFSPPISRAFEALAREMRFEVTLAPTGSPDRPAARAHVGRRRRRRSRARFPSTSRRRPTTARSSSRCSGCAIWPNVALMRAGKNSYNMQAVFVLGVLMITVTALGARLRPPAGVARPPHTRSLWRPPRALLAYFAAIGLGFMLDRDLADAAPDHRAGPSDVRAVRRALRALLSSGLGSFLTRNVSPAPCRPVGPRAARRGSWPRSLAFGLVTPLAVGCFEADDHRRAHRGRRGDPVRAGTVDGHGVSLGMKLAHGRAEPDAVAVGHQRRDSPFVHRCSPWASRWRGRSPRPSGSAAPATPWPCWPPSGWGARQATRLGSASYYNDQRLEHGEILVCAYRHRRARGGRCARRAAPVQSSADECGGDGVGAQGQCVGRLGAVGQTSDWDGEAAARHLRGRPDAPGGARSGSL